MYGPLELSEKIEKIVVDDNRRKYYRFRPAKWYGGIVTGDVLGCNLRCVFCWLSEVPRNSPEKIGKFHSPEEAFRKLCWIAEKKNIKQMRLSGSEPTIGKEHLLELLELIDKTEYSFILETNGILLDEDYAKSLSEFRNLHVRVSFKGTNEKEFSILTGAKPEGFALQLKAIENLVKNNVSCHPAVMVSFSEKENFEKLISKFKEIDSNLEVEIEELILYPHVLRRLEKYDIKYKKGHDPENVPERLI
ncbi:MAG: radical SAM protein [Candidatus Thermoplasmatota archaeon]|nr:radical SAM protein [Candidatus Thermoplasmatota archaeon]